MNLSDAQRRRRVRRGDASSVSRDGHVPLSVKDALLPHDSDIEADEDSAGHPTPVHLSWVNIVLVAVGGTAGTALRYAITTVAPRIAGVPIATFAVNVVGAFLLGVLLEALARRGRDAPRRRMIRLLVGTGGLGGFTTYSALATDTMALLDTHPGRALAYALATVGLGTVASALGIWSARPRSGSAAVGDGVQP